MPLRRNSLNLFALTLVAAATWANLEVRAGERIRFSKPAVELAAPGADSPKLPGPKERTMDFGSPTSPNDMDATLQMRPQVIPLPTRRQVEEDLSPLALRDPHRQYERAMQDRDRLNGRDPLELRDPSRRGMENGTESMPWSLDQANPRRKDEARSLAPITEFGWQAPESGGKARDAARNGRNGALDREREAARNPFDLSDRFSNEANRPSSPFEIFSARPKEKPTAQQLERRASFERLLNPSADPALSKGPDSLQPVGSSPSQPAALGLPTVGATPNRVTPANTPPADPTVAYNRQQERWNGPVFDDAYKKYAPPPAPAPAPTPTATSFQTPLNRQPIQHEFPTRRF